MKCHFVGLFKNGKLSGIALIQFINLADVTTFKNKKSRFCIREYLFKKFASHILFIGNNTLTGQNAYLHTSDITEIEALQLMHKALKKVEKEYNNKGQKINLLAVKDFNEKEFPNFDSTKFKNYFKFCTQPNMIFGIREEWNDINDYLTDLNTKYRTQYKRARKKEEGVIRRKLTADEIQSQQLRVNELYHTVANRASFNTFFLPENHFEIMKRELKDKFRFYGYFLNDKLVGFSTLIKNGKDMDTYFLGYDETVQKEKMLYLNMLYDMVAYAIKKQYKHIIFARSAMEIKSSVGAEAEEVHGIIKHTNPFINLFIGKLFSYFDPKVEWKARSPFK
ncbi:GNAT family N-acetyltransferase [Flavobacterium arcticum]|uniref:GNAT family N-acetyltransferase n=2 Tax=Flavobacterium arcticum TaxID=1784713 RepID=A0A345HF49_9FLAO|nr:GNAT family N-acetyltransferase [Flavobacterium arcticum]KAF2513381.1 GNAT family N-acetyltransferase [Flavobacterium arcticum]